MRFSIFLACASVAFGQLSVNPQFVDVPAPTSAQISAGYILGASGWQAPPTGGGGGGSNALCGSSPAPGNLALVGTQSNQSICLGIGQYNITVAQVLSGSKILIMGAGPGTIVTRINSTDGFDVTGDDVMFSNLSYTGNGVGGGYAFLLSGNRFRSFHLWFSAWGGNSLRGLIRITKGTGNRFDEISFLDSPAEHDLIAASDSGDVSDLIVSNSHFSNSSSTYGMAFEGTGGGFVYDIHAHHNTWSGVGRCLYVLLNSTKPRTSDVDDLSCELAADTSLDMVGVWGCDGMNFSNIQVTDNNHGMGSQPAMTFHDANNCHVVGYTAKLFNVGSKGFQALDSHGSTASHIKIYGGGGNAANAANTGMIEVGMGAPGSNGSQFSLDDVEVEMPAGATNAAVRVADGLSSSDKIDDFSIRGLKVLGPGSSGTGIVLATANGASMDSPMLDQIQCRGLSVCVNVGSGVTNALIGMMRSPQVTTPIVNNGTNTVIK